MASSLSQKAEAISRGARMLRTALGQTITAWLQDPAVVEVTAAAQACAVPLAILESWLIERDYVGGGAFTLGDVPLGPVIHRWSRLPLAKPAFPALDAYRRRLEERPAYRAHIATLT